MMSHWRHNFSMAAKWKSHRASTNDIVDEDIYIGNLFFFFIFLNTAKMKVNKASKFLSLL